MPRSPLDRMPQPTTPKKLVPVLDDEITIRLFATCDGKSFLDRRDTAIIRLLFDTGGRLSEVANLSLNDVNLKTDTVQILGKGDKYLAVPFGANTGRALSRYIRARAKQPGADLPNLWLSSRGPKPLRANGVKIMLRRRGEDAEIEGMHAHRFRHTLAHEWKVQGGNDSALMEVMGWTSAEMVRHYGKAAAQTLAQQAHRDMALGDRL